MPIVSCLLLFVIDNVSHNCFPSVEERDCDAIAVCFLLVEHCALCEVYSRCRCPVRYHFGKKRERRSLSRHAQIHATLNRHDLQSLRPECLQDFEWLQVLLAQFVSALLFTLDSIVIITDRQK